MPSEKTRLIRSLRGVECEIIDRRVNIAHNNLKAQQYTAEITRQRFAVGFVSALDVANTNAQVATIASQITVTDVITIYKALGGGWEGTLPGGVALCCG